MIYDKMIENDFLFFFFFWFDDMMVDEFMRNNKAVYQLHLLEFIYYYLFALLEFN